MKFKDLEKGDRFIGFPDNDLSEKPYFIFIKMNSDEISIHWNAVKECNGRLSGMPDNMEVLRVK